jgi:hypothetical protein
MLSIRNDMRRQPRLFAILALALAGLFCTDASAQRSSTCAQTTDTLSDACEYEAADDQRVGFAICMNITNPTASQACRRNVQTTYMAALQECDDVEDAREAVCAVVGGGAYDPVIHPANFVPRITNMYAPFQPGRWWEYRKVTDEGTERIRIDVLNQTRTIQGVTVTTLRDRVWLDGVPVEDTIDWLAQQTNGDVRYFGEIVQNFKDGQLDNLDGSFEAGKNGAKSGIWVKYAPRVGEFYRQEWSPNNAEDMVEILDLDAPDNVPFRNGKPVLKTRDFTPLSPDAVEFKFYVPGVGFVLEIDPATGEELRLVDYGPR